jgi:lipopolysaccharide transport system ATP-binding protein
MNAAISVNNLSKQYRLGASKSRRYRTLRDTISETVCEAGERLRQIVWGLAGRSDSPRDTPVETDLWALKDVSFEVRPGEMVGIIGRNGAGKSTLLKIISRITEPSGGRLALRGHVGSLLEVGTGFHQELTGRENIYLNGAILGMSRRAINRKFDAIVEFAELAQFIDTPVKHYSSGMYVRLAFAVSSQMEPNILLLDEVLSVGDLAFQRKCMEHAKRLRDCNATVLFVSHNMFAVKAMCDRVIYLSKGRLFYDGPSDEGIKLYEKDSRLGTASWAQDMIDSDPSQRRIQMTEIETRGEDGQPKTVFDHGERMRVRLKFEAPQRLHNPNFVICFIRSDNVACCNYSTGIDGVTIPTVSGSGVVELLTPPLKLVSEHYAIQVLVWDETFQRLYCAQEGASFHVRHDLLSTHFGVFHEPADWCWVDS